MNFFIMVSIFLSAALGVFRGIDLALLTDAETGLCIAGSVWLRYGALAVAVGTAVAAAAAVSRRPARCGATARLPASWHWAGGRLLWPGCCAARLLDGEQRGNADPGRAGGAVRVLDDRSRPELAAEGLEDPPPQSTPPCWAAPCSTGACWPALWKTAPAGTGWPPRRWSGSCWRG